MNLFWAPHKKNPVMKKQGIYRILNKQNRKRYFGSTQSSFEERWANHLSQLRLMTHKNKHLQSSWKIYGENAFEFSIVLTCRPEECLYFEQLYLDMYWDNGNHCYNIRKIADSNYGCKRSQETIEQISKSKIGIKSKRNQSGYSGVSKTKNNSWQASIRHNQKAYYLGCFKTVEEANTVYQEALYKLINNIQLPPNPLLKSTNKSGYANIYYHGGKGMWASTIREGKKIHTVGFFQTIEEAYKSQQDTLQMLDEGGALPNKKVLGKSGFVGIRFEKRRNLWLAEIKRNGKISYIGSFITIEEAIDARNASLTSFSNGSPLLKSKTRLRRTNKSGIKGVSWDESSKKWVAQIRSNGKQRYIGRFLTKEEAEQALMEYEDIQTLFT